MPIINILFKRGVNVLNLKNTTKICWNIWNSSLNFGHSVGNSESLCEFNSSLTLF